MTNIDKQLKEIRPSLRLVAPLTFYISFGYALFNIFIGPILFHIPPTKFFVVGVISLHTWAIIFTLLGITSLYTLMTNNWRTLRLLMLAGVMVKAAWLMELVARTFSGSSFFLVLLWGLLLYLQMITYIYFTPVENHGAR